MFVGAVEVCLGCFRLSSRVLCVEGYAFGLSQKEVALCLFCGYNAPACWSMLFISLPPI